MTPPLPRQEDLPSNAELRRGGVAVGIVAAALLIIAVLPAEAGIDPTGAGGLLGLTEMARVAEVAPPPQEAAPPLEFKFRTDELSVTLTPGQGTEVKAVMRAGDQMAWAWHTDGAPVHHEFHGEPKGAAKDVYSSYEIGTAPSSQGEFEAPFEGLHGWYWKNDGPAPVVVTVNTTGVYSHISRIH